MLETTEFKEVGSECAWWADIIDSKKSTSKAKCARTAPLFHKEQISLIRTFRKKYHFTQQMLASRLGVSAPTICVWEKKGCPKIAALAIEGLEREVKRERRAIIAQVRT